MWLYFVIGIVCILFGYIAGVVMSNYGLPVLGTLIVDMSDDAKDIYRLVFDDLEKAIDGKDIVLLKIDRINQKSQD